jgi:pimeloyl-ACP methyl ester carboxylesterase
MAEQARPGTFAGLALFEPIVLPPDRPAPDGEIPIVAGARRRRPEFTNRLEAFENYAAKPPLNVLTREALAAYVEHGFVDTDHHSVRLACEPEHEARVFESSNVPGAWDALRTVPCPVLLLSGREEAFQPSSYTARIASEIPRAALQRFGQLGHFGPLEEPDVVGDAIAAYFLSL